MSGLLDFHSVLIACGKNPTENLKLYRHANSKNSDDPFTLDIEKVITHGDLEIFQSVQSNKQLGNGMVAFFMGESGRLSRFLGIWHVDSIHDWKYESERAEQAREKGYLRTADIWHELRYDQRFTSYENRLIVEWPETGRHHQWLVESGVERRSLEVKEIRGKGMHKAFPGFDKVVLSFNELNSLISNDAAGWKEALSSTRGVYLITDSESGDQYVGSATGANGIWGRWRDYAKTRHGNNKIMIDRVQNIETFADNLKFSILETLGNLATRQDGIAAEVRWKSKLGKRATILNAN